MTFRTGCGANNTLISRRKSPTMATSDADPTGIMGRLTTHVLDTAHGRPGAGIRIDLYRVGGRARAAGAGDHQRRRPLRQAAARGRQLARPGAYELVFHVGDYFAGNGLTLPEPRFLDEVVIRFGVARPDEHYHVPLLLSPYGYSTYRGS